jgi:HK97 gp10 family phage protein
MEFEGLDDLIEQVNSLADETEMQQITKRIVTKSRDIAAERMRGKIKRSANNQKSGKKGYRPPGHAADNIPVSSIRMSGGEPTAAVGWEKADSSAFFYMKFVEWGTYKMAPRDFIYSTINECWAAFDAAAEAEMQKFITSKLGSD